MSAEESTAFFNPYAEVRISKANLPHWKQDHVPYFVTFRLADAVPRKKWEQWKFERDAWTRRHPEPWDDKTWTEFHALFSVRVQEYLDSRQGSCILAIRKVRTIVDEALLYFANTRYELGAHVVATNHVHAVVLPHEGWQLSDILHSWKSFSAKAINNVEAASRRLNRILKSRRFGTSTVWQKESYDHIIRNAGSLYRIEQYIKRHPENRD